MGSIWGQISHFVAENIIYFAMGFVVITLVIMPLTSFIIHTVKENKRKNKVETMTAKVLAKRIYLPGENTSNYAMEQSENLKYAKQGQLYYVTFEADNGRRVELPLTHEVYDQLTEGSHGTLVYKGGACISFDLDDQK